MTNQTPLLQGYSDLEKGAYLGAIASIATADHTATEDELEFIRALCDEAGLSQSQKQAVERAATDLTAEELQRCLDVIKTSQLRYSLLADLIAFAEADGTYSDEEKKNVEKIAQHLGIDQKQFSLLDQFVHKSNSVPAEQAAKPGFLDSLGLGDQFKKSGINMDALTKGLLGIAGPMLLARLVTGGMQRRGRMPSGMGSGMRMPGGFGSLMSQLNSGRGYRRSGGMLSRILGF